jgi:hypothetical protein
LSLSTPIALFIFKRPDLTARVLGAIAQARPTKLFVIADGPRNEAEKPKCESARAVLQQVDWDCDVLTNFSDTNMKGPWRVSSGISWVFSHVEEAILLEDDCLPAPSFFTFCQDLLDRYREDERVMHISGDNFQGDHQRTEYSYYFSKYSDTWGWATWRRAWKYFDLYMKTWPAFKASGMFHDLCDTAQECQYWATIFDHCVDAGDVHWDYAWLYACWCQNGLSIIPHINLVTNVGFGSDATHTSNAADPLANLPLGDIGSLSHPPYMARHKTADRYAFRHHFSPPRSPHLLRRWLGKIRRGLRLGPANNGAGRQP